MSLKWDDKVEKAGEPTDTYVRARLILKGFADANARLARELARKCDWDMPDDVLAYQRGRVAEAREKLLNKLVPDRRCSCCGEIKVKSKSWVVNRRVAVCRSCWTRGVGVRAVTDSRIFSGGGEIDGKVLKRCRRRAGLGVKAFAGLVGVAPMTVRAWERGGRCVGSELAGEILAALAKRGVRTGDLSVE